MDEGVLVPLQKLGGTAILGLLVLLLILRLWKRRSEKENHKLPPGPRPWPILGNLPLLSPLLHQDFKKLSDRFGHIFHLRLGSTNCVVISSPKLAEEVLKTKDMSFLSRPTSSAGRIMVYGGVSVGLSSYGPYWRHIRKVYTLELMTAKRIRQFEKRRMTVLLWALDLVINGCKDGNAIRLDELLWKIITKNICRMAFHKTFDHDDDVSDTAAGDRGQALEDNMKTVFSLFTVPVLGDFIPFLRHLDIGGYKKQMRVCGNQIDELMEGMIKERQQNELKRTDSGSLDDEKLDLLDVLLTTRLSEEEGPMTREQVKALLLEVLGAGIETQATTLGWAFSELLRNPSVLARAQEELDNTIQGGEIVQEADLPHLPYIRAIVDETFRLHPPAPVLLPHQSSEETVLGDRYYIPQNTQVFINAWAMGRDPALWENPLEFCPERFLTADVNSGGTAFKLLPFGAGRRSCPGRPLALTMVEFTLAILLHACNWALPEGMISKDIDMREAPGLSVPRLVPLETIGSPRLPLSTIFAAQNS